MRPIRFSGHFLIAPGLIALAWLPAAALAETTLCTVIATLPATIATPGVYCLQSDFSYNSLSVPAITIAANNVTLDLNAHRIGDLAAGTAVSTYGVYALNQQNITIKNGILRGFGTGVLLTDSASPPAISQGHLIQDIRADQNRLAGIQVVGSGSIVRHNQVVATGGSTIAASENAVGIWVSGANNGVLNNDVSGTTASGSGNAFGIQGSGAEGLMVIGNRVSETSSPSGLESGIYITGSPHAAIRKNVVNNATVPANPAQSVGISMDSATDIFLGNTSGGFGSGSSGGNDPLPVPACAYALNPASASVSYTAGSGAFFVSTAFGCPWTAVSNDSWITVTSGASGSMTGAVQYSYALNTTTVPRTGTITAGGLTFTLNQAASGTVVPVVYSGTATETGYEEGSIPGCSPDPWTTTVWADPWDWEWDSTSNLLLIGPSSITLKQGAITVTAQSQTITCPGMPPLVIPAMTASVTSPASSNVFPVSSDGTNITISNLPPLPAGCTWTQTTTTITRNPVTNKGTITGTWIDTCVFAGILLGPIYTIKFQLQQQ